jgi:homoserine dehydrogenase
MQQKKIGVGLLGCGTVGGGVSQVILQQADHLEKRSGVRLELKKVLVRDSTKARPIPPALITTRPEDVIDNPDIGIVVELIGGLQPAGDWILRSIKNGKRVVTANKYLLAHRGGELFSAAAAAGSCVCFEASCGGAIPIVLALTRGLIANEIKSVVGILNGTCNYILTQMTQNDKPYSVALAEAQQAGFAEADPHMDVSGLDSGHKLAVLASLAFGANIGPDDIDIHGITSLQDVDLRYARELGYVCKLLAIAQRQDSGVSLRVHPALIPLSHPLAGVNGSYNAVSVDGSVAGRTVYFGRGAGAMPTASAVLADILEAAMGPTAAFFASHPLLNHRHPISIISPAAVNTRHYLRIAALDKPGTVHQITGVLGRHRISISAMTQHEAKAGAYVPLVITTHEALDGGITEALAELSQLSCVSGVPAHLRILDDYE